MSAFTLAALLAFYPSVDPDTVSSRPHPCTASPSTGGLAASVGVPLAFAAAHPAARLATEGSAPGYRAYGVIVWHRPLGVPSGGYRPPRLARPHRPRHARPHRRPTTRSSSTASSQSSSSSSSLSTQSDTSNADAAAATAPPPLPAVSSAAPVMAAWASAARGTRATPPTPAIPQESKVVVVLHGFDAAEPPAEDDTPRLWRVLQPLQWWLDVCVRPAWRHPFQQPQQHQLACGLRVFVSPAALPLHRPQLCVAPSPPVPATPAAAGAAPLSTPPPAWAAGAVLELQLCGPANESALLFSSHDVLRAVRQRGSGACAFGSFAKPFVPQAASSFTALSAAGNGLSSRRGAARGGRWQRRFLELLRPEDVWVMPLDEAGGGDAAGVLPPARRVPAGPPPPLLPLHTLDLSFRTDVVDLEGSLASWAAAGLLRCLRRLSLMGCRQLGHLRWVAALPRDELEVLNLSGCDALRNLRALRRLRALRQLRAAQLPHLERLGWWDGAADGAVATATALEWPALIEELDLRCAQRRTRPIDDFACLSLLHRLRRLAVTVPEEPRTGADTPASPRSVVNHTDGPPHLSHPPLSGSRAVTELVSVALQRWPFALEWLTGCAELRELRLAFRCGRNEDGRAAVPAGPTVVAQLAASLAASAVSVAALARLVRPGSSSSGSDHTEHATAADWPLSTRPPAPPPPTASTTAAGHGALAFLRLRPFPLLETLEVTGAVLADPFTTALATGCPRLRELRLYDCVVRCSAAGMQAAQAAAAEAPQLTAPRRVSAEWDAAHRARDEQWWWGQLGRLRRLRLLCVIGAEGLLDGSSLDWIVACTALRHLTVRQCRWLLDAYAVHRLPRLRTLNLSNTGIDDVTFLRMREGVVVAGALVDAAQPLSSATSSAAAAAGAAAPSALQRLRSPFRSPASAASPALAPLLPRSVRVTALTSAPPATLSHLTELVLIDCTFVRDLTPLSCLAACRRLFASDHHHVTSLDHLAGCTAMEELYLIHYAKLTDTSALRWLRRLRVLYITHSSVRDWGWVAQSTQTTGHLTSPATQGRNGWGGGGGGRGGIMARGGRRARPGAGVHPQPTAEWDSATAADAGADGEDVRDSASAADMDREDDASNGRVLPLLEVLTLTDSRLLTDVRPLGALPRLRQLYLSDCIALTTLGAADVQVPGCQHDTAAAHGLAARRAGDDAGGAVAAAGGMGAGPFPVAWPAPPPLSYWAAAHAVAARLARVPQSVSRRLAHAKAWAAHVWRRSSGAVMGWSARDAAQSADAPGAGNGSHDAAAAAVAAAAPVSSTAAGWSLAHLRGTLRYLSISRCSALTDGRAVGSLTHLEYLHAPFTGLREVRWITRCRALKVVDLVSSPCCVGEAKLALEAALPQRLPRLELLNNRPVDEPP